MTPHLLDRMPSSKTGGARPLDMEEALSGSLLRLDRPFRPPHAGQDRGHRPRQRTPASPTRNSTRASRGSPPICATSSKVARGDRVAVLALNTTDTLEVQFACGRIGAVFLPLNTRLTVPELQFIVGDASPKVMIHDADLAEIALTVAKLCDVSSALLLGAGGSYEAAIAAAKPLDRAEDVTLDDISTIMYTSGTTGQPKGAIITHGMTFWNCVNLGGPAYISPSSVLLTVLPLFHTGGLNCYTNPVLHAGGTVLIMRAFDPGLALQLISDPARGINQFFGVPAIYQFMAQHPAFADVRLQPAGDRRRRRRADAGAAAEGVGSARRRAAAGLRHDRDQPGGADARQGGRRAQGRLVRQAGAAYGSADRSPRRHRRRCRRTRRTLGQGPERHARLLEQAGRQRVVLHRRLAAHRRRHARRRGRLLLHRRPLEGHVHLRRRERLSGRSRERAAPARRRSPRPPSSASPTSNGARSAWRSSR